MKRAKQRSFSADRGGDDEADFFKKPAAPEKTWTEHVEGKDEGAFHPYNLSSRYERGALIAHTKFGKGVVVNADSTNIEVLFEAGKKKLGHGVASS